MEENNTSFICGDCYIQYGDEYLPSCTLNEYTGPDIDVLEIPESINGQIVRFIHDSFWKTIQNVKAVSIPYTVSPHAFCGNRKFCTPNRIYLKNLESISVDEKNPWMHSIDGVLYLNGPNYHEKRVNSMLYMYPPNRPGFEFSVPKGCTSIYNEAFRAANNLVTVKLGDVKNIGIYSFSDCHKLKNINLNKVLSIDNHAFSGCCNLEEIALLSAEKVVSKAFENCKGLRSISIGNDKLDYDFNCLWQCNELKEINIYGKARKRFAVIDGVLYSFRKKIEPVFCPSNNFRKEISLLPYVSSFRSDVFYECKNVKYVIYNSKTTLQRMRVCHTLFLKENFPEEKYGPVKNNGYLLYVPGPVVDYLDLSDIHDFGNIAFRDVKRIRHMRVGHLLSENQIQEIMQLVNVGEVLDYSNLESPSNLIAPISNTETKEEHVPETKGKKVVVPKYNIIIVSQKFICIREGHKLEDVIIQVRLLHHGNISIVPVAGGYCSSCRRYYIYSEIFDNFLRGLRPGTVILQNRFKAPNGMYGEVYDVTAGLRSQSLLNRCGYSVSYNNGLSDGSRIELLRQIINSKLMTKQEVMSYLNYFINFNGKKSGNEYAKMMWEKDLMALSKM